MASRRENCRLCHRHESACGPLSKRGRCARCANQAAVQAANQMARKAGPYYEAWLRSAGGKST